MGGGFGGILLGFLFWFWFLLMVVLSSPLGCDLGWDLAVSSLAVWSCGCCSSAGDDFDGDGKVDAAEAAGNGCVLDSSILVVVD